MKAHFDHVVLNVADVERALHFYVDVVGFATANLELWRGGLFPFPSARINERMVLDLFGPERWSPDGERGPSAQRLHHFSLVIDEAEWPALEERLTGAGVAIRGPLRQWGGWDYGLSYYVFDPDGNEVEFRVYPEGDAREIDFDVVTDRAQIADAELLALGERAGSPHAGEALLQRFASSPHGVAFVKANGELVSAARRLADGKIEYVFDPPYLAVGYYLLSSRV